MREDMTASCLMNELVNTCGAGKDFPIVESSASARSASPASETSCAVQFKAGGKGAGINAQYPLGLRIA